MTYGPDVQNSFKCLVVGKTPSSDKTQVQLWSETLIINFNTIHFLKKNYFKEITS
jgi:hypothetical protein